MDTLASGFETAPTAVLCVHNPRYAGVTRFVRSALFILAFTCIGFKAAPAQQSQPTEFQIKAAYLYNFGKFVRWPENSAPQPGSRFLICVLGKDVFRGALETVVTGQTIGGGPVEVKKIEDERGMSDCRVLYVSGNEVRRFRPVLDGLRKQPVVTVSDSPEFLQRGGMIQFVLVENRVRFEINLNAAREAGLQLSAELLKVAVKVVGADSGSGGSGD